jgi:hypothetical protein
LASVVETNASNTLFACGARPTSPTTAITATFRIQAIGLTFALTRQIVAGLTEETQSAGATAAIITTVFTETTGLAVVDTVSKGIALKADRTGSTRSSTSIVSTLFKGAVWRAIGHTLAGTVACQTEGAGTTGTATTIAPTFLSNTIRCAAATLCHKDI